MVDIKPPKGASPWELGEFKWYSAKELDDLDKQGSLFDALGLPEEIVNATIDHDQPRPLPETMRTLADVVFIGNILAGTHLEWFQETADPESGQTGEVRQRFAELLPQIESDTQEMLAAFA